MRLFTKTAVSGMPFGVLFLLLCLVWPARADDIDRQRQNLKEIQNRIERLSKQLDTSKVREGEAQQELMELEKELSGLQQNSTRLEKRLNSVKKDILAKETRIASLTDQISEKEQQVRRRLGAVYRRGEMRLFKVLFQKDSPSRVAENFLYLTRLVRQDRLLLNDYREDWRALQTALQELENLHGDQQRRLSIIDASQKTLKNGRKIRKAAISKLRNKREAIKDEIAQLEEKARRLRKLLKTLESEKSGAYSGSAVGFKKQKGRLPWPVQGKLVVRFGTNFNAGLDTRIESQGIEIAQKPGLPMCAVAAGKVVFSKPFRGFGNLLILDHGDGYYTLYAQASQLLHKVGDVVAAGDKVGLSGFGGSDTVYFEIRQRGTPLDPLQWLKPRS
ncbi:zinc metalloendopeptidase M23 domain protein [Syntrophotalea carbinolica DSM 2380]|uniref:Zinc metalloendopeptidase M23 domain protein n=1 Tax=Syntrophotalea carbinolica (strain DSM 2380 / NBRC 103641 / GraBd1) TaxID=338963 RepID=Q3A3Y9_SYNC1|nr:peptidoglycan DD-metalloendopeptidase family protein [Syntrophotalea carbinolica]ABA88918.1 zinc metalloendopeptidase M23 domain protein [Syntrophotalea carbinolica DSM 2380]